MKKSKLLVAALVLLSPLTSCNNQETSSASSAPADLVLNENQGVKLVKQESVYTPGAWFPDSTYSTCLDINFSLTHMVGDKQIRDYPFKYTTIRIEQPKSHGSGDYEDFIGGEVGSLYTGVLKIEFNFADDVWQLCGGLKDNNGEWVPGPIDSGRYCDNLDGTYIDNPVKYQELAVAATGSYFLEVYDL